MIKNVAILFYLKRRANANEEKVPVYVRITCDGQRVEMATGQKIHPKSWDPTQERAKGKANVFTEQGISMLSGILNSERAISVNIQIMRIFSKVREVFLDNTEIRLKLEKIKTHLSNHDKNIELVFQYLDEFLKSKIPLRIARESVTNQMIINYTTQPPSAF